MTTVEDLLSRDFEPAYGAPVQVSPLIRRVVAQNPGKFTFRGTGTYLVGHGSVAVIDPGPADPAHVGAVEYALERETVTHILVTHTHLDHSPAARPLAAATGAPVLAYGRHPLSAIEERDADEGGQAKVEESGDTGFEPDVTLDDGDVVEGAGWTLEAVHTPGHMSNHLCFSLGGERALFSGDHVMGWSTTVIPPPDGNMAAYLESLRRVRARHDETYWPTHGPPVSDPERLVDALLDHRARREAEILECLREGAQTIGAMVPTIYSETPSELHVAAGRSVLAHLIHLVSTGRVACDGEPTGDSTFALV